MTSAPRTVFSSDLVRCAAALLLLAPACTPAPTALDGGRDDAGAANAPLDAGALDAGALDAGALDAGEEGGLDAGAFADAGDVHDDAGDAATDAGDTDAGDDVPPPETCSAPASLGRGNAWVRQNPMLISGLSVAMGAPSVAAVNAYFDDFHANAVHLWENGLPNELGAWSAAGHEGFRYLSWVHRDGTSVDNAQVLGGMAPLPGRVGYQIGDEPTDQTSLAEIAAGAAAVKAADPEGLRIINLNDSDGANALRQQAAQLADIDVLSYDHYEWGRGAYGGLGDTRAKALAAGKPYWRYILSFHYKDEAAEGTLSDLRWDAFVGAVYGFTGYTWFVYSIDEQNESVAPLLFDTGGDFSAARTPLYDAAAAVNVELAQLGRTLVLLESQDVRFVARYPILKPPGVAAWSAGAGGDPYLSAVTLEDDRDALLGLFRDDCDEPYVMLQNQAHDGADLPNNSASAASFTLSFDFSSAEDESLDESALLALDLTSGDIVTLPLTSTGASSAALEVSLPAGGVLLFKYKTARPFTRQ